METYLVLTVSFFPSFNPFFHLYFMSLWWHSCQQHVYQWWRAAGGSRLRRQCTSDNGEGGAVCGWPVEVCVWCYQLERSEQPGRMSPTWIQRVFLWLEKCFTIAIACLIAWLFQTTIQYPYARIIQFYFEIAWGSLEIAQVNLKLHGFTWNCMGSLEIARVHLKLHGFTWNCAGWLEIARVHLKLHGVNF